MKNESFKETLKYLDKKTLRKICVSFKKQIEDKEVEIFRINEELSLYKSTYNKT